MRALALLFALLAPSVASAGAGGIFAPDPRYIPGTYLPFQTYLGGLGISASLAGPSLQAINTGTGNAIEAYVQGKIQGLVLSYQGATTNALRSSADPFKPRPYLGVHDYGGFVEVFGSRTDGGSDFTGGGLAMGGTRGSTNYPDRGYGVVSWTDAFGGTLQFQTAQQGNRFGFSSGASGVNESFFQIANGVAVWDFVARSSNVPATHSYRWGCQSQDRPLHSTWYNAAGNTLMSLTSTTGNVGSLTVHNGNATVNGAVVPLTDNTGSVGTGSQRWASVRATVVTTGDLGFEDECCPVCGACFKTGEDVVWRIRRQKRESDGKTLSFAVPVHVGCSK